MPDAMEAAYDAANRLDFSGEKQYNDYKRDFQRKYRHDTGHLNAIKEYAEQLGWVFEYV